MLKLYYEEQSNLIEMHDLRSITQTILKDDKVCLLYAIDPQYYELDFLIQELNLHLITIKNFKTSKHIPKLESYPAYVSTTMYDIELANNDDCYTVNPIGIILMKNLTLILSQTDLLAMDEIMTRINNNLTLNFSDPCNLYYIALDVLVDNLFPILSCFEKKLDLIQENALKDYEKNYAKKLLTVRSGLLKLNKVFIYEKEVLYEISHEKLNFICQEDAPYMKDVYHHLEKLNVTLKEFNDWASNLSDTYTNDNTAKVNDRLQLLTVIQYVFMPLSFLTGWYGMNFKMPETDPAIAYYIFILIVTTISISMILYFKKKKLL